MLRLALAQINSIVGDLKGNREKIQSFIKQAKEFNADIVSFPELAICGYPPEDLVLKEYFVKDSLKELGILARSIFGIAAIIGFIDKDKNGNLYNAACVIQNTKIKGVYYKKELPNYSVFDEKRYFNSGAKSPLFKIKDFIFGVNICEDIWKENGVVKFQVDKGADLIINISASPYFRGKVDLRKRIVSRHAKKSKVYICYNNLVGGQDELVFDGASFILNHQGKEVAAAKQFEEDLIIVDLLMKAKQASVGNSKYYKNYIKLDNAAVVKKSALPGIKYKKLNRVEEIYNCLTLGVRDYIKKNNFKKAVIGLSGGIDSALTAVIACDAIGPDNVVGVSMPSKYSSLETQSDAKALAKNLGIKFIVVPIGIIFNAYLDELKDGFSGLNSDITEENIQARIRGNILMAFSNKFGWLVLTTGNKSETSVGYCTLYGDMAGGFNVLKDVYKTLVYKLVEFRNEKENKIIIPESIIKRAPTAELKLNQKDQDNLPPYPILDKILEEYVEKDKNFNDIAKEKNIAIDIVKKVVNMVDKSEYKRRQSPPGIKITPKAFGKDRRLPITNNYRIL